MDLEVQILTFLDAGDVDTAATTTIRGYGPELLGYIGSVVRDDTTAADVFAQTCEDVWRGLGTFRRESAVRTWTYRLAWHAISRHFRDPHRRRQEPLSTGRAAELAVEVRSTTALHLRQTGHDALVEMRAQLTPDEQTLLVLRIDRDLTWPEIARILDEGEATLRKRFERLKDRLRDEARRRGLIEG